MAVKIRLSRAGQRNRASYRIVVADERFPRNGRNIELIGRYDPHVDPGAIVLDSKRLDYWLSKGAQLTDATRRIVLKHKRAEAAAA